MPPLYIRLFPSYCSHCFWSNIFLVFPRERFCLVYYSRISQFSLFACLRSEESVLVTITLIIKFLVILKHPSNILNSTYKCFCSRYVVKKKKNNKKTILPVAIFLLRYYFKWLWGFNTLYLFSFFLELDFFFLSDATLVATLYLIL